MLGYYKEPELTRAGVDRRRLAAHRRQGRARRGRPPADHRPRQGPLQDQQGQVRRAGADRGPARDARGRRGLLRHRREPRPAGRARDAERGGGAARSRTRPARGALEASLAAHLRRVNATLDPHEQLDCLVVVTRGVDGRQRPRHADAQGQAQPHRRPCTRSTTRAGSPSARRSSGTSSERCRV